MSKREKKRFINLKWGTEDSWSQPSNKIGTRIRVLCNPGAIHGILAPRSDGDGNSMPQIQFGRFHFHFRSLGCHFQPRDRDNQQVAIRLQIAECRHCRFPFPPLAFAFSTSSSLFRRVRPWSRHRTSTPVLAKHPPSRLFSCPTRPSAGVSPKECLWSVPRVRIIGGPEPAHPHAGAWCQMVTLPPTPDAATELPAQAGLVATAAAAAVSFGPAVEGTPHPPRHPSRSMARLRLGYTKSRTGCLRCKQRRVKVAPVTPPRPRRV